MTTLRLVVLNCNVSESVSAVIASAAEAAAGPGTEITTLTPTWGVASAEGYLDSQRYDRPYDAAVLAGFGEAGREAFRELLDVPVVDITEAAAHLALLVAPRYAVLTSLSRTVVQIQDSLCNAGVLQNCVGVRATEIPVLKIASVARASPDSTAPCPWRSASP